MGSRGSGPPGRRRPRGEGLPRNSRIRQGGEIRSLLRQGTRHRAPHLEVFSAPAPEGVPRYGTIVPKYGRNVVARNRLRRRLREIGRREVLPALRERGCDADVLVRARRLAYDASFDELRDELHLLTERLCSSVSSSA